MAARRQRDRRHLGQVRDESLDRARAWWQNARGEEPRVSVGPRV